VKINEGQVAKSEFIRVLERAYLLLRDPHTTRERMRELVSEIEERLKAFKEHYLNG